MSRRVGGGKSPTTLADDMRALNQAAARFLDAVAADVGEEWRLLRKFSLRRWAAFTLVLSAVAFTVAGVWLVVT